MKSPKPEEFYPKVGVSIMVLKDDQVLIGKRKGSHGSGEWAFPGGSLEYMETLSECVHREIAEEAGITVSEPEFVRIYNLREYAPKHFLDVAMKVQWLSGEPKVLEPDKCEAWVWCNLDDLPQPLFKPVKELFDAYKAGKSYIKS